MKSNTKMVGWIDHRLSRPGSPPISKIISVRSVYVPDNMCHEQSCKNFTRYSHRYISRVDHENVLMVVIELCALHTYQVMNGWLRYGYHLPFDDSELMKV